MLKLLKGLAFWIGDSMPQIPACYKLMRLMPNLNKAQTKYIAQDPERHEYSNFVSTYKNILSK
jgi:hypothetical protein